MTLGSTFAGVKEKYFPRWDRANRWRVIADDSHDSTGYCDSRQRTVFVRPEVFGMTEDGLRALLIHEICHDIGGAGHGVGWANRMLKAANKADSLGESELANQILASLYADVLSGVLAKLDVDPRSIEERTLRN